MTWSVEEKRLVLKGDQTVWDRPNSFADRDIDMSAAFTSPPIDVLYFDLGSIAAVWTGADATDGNLFVEASANRINWCKISASDRAVNEAAQDALWWYPEFAVAEMRVVYEPGANTAGTLNMYYTLKSRR